MALNGFKSTLVSFGMMLGGVLLAFLALELVFRLMPAGRPKFNFASERPAYYFLPRHSANMQGNAQKVEKAPGEYRIVVIGDSFTFAPEMQYLDAFPKRLENMLSTASTVSVINLGTPGFSTMNEWKSLTTALTYNPDLILLQVTLNDPQVRALQLEPDEIKGSFGPYKPLSWLARHSRFVSWVGERIHNTRSVSSYIDYHEYLWSDNWARFTKPFDAMRAQAAAAKVDFGVVLFPLFDFPLTKNEYPFLDIHRKISGFVKGTNTPFLDLFSAYEGLDPYRLQLMPGRDTHPNEIAHRIAAEKIYWWMRRQAFFPGNRRLGNLYPRRANLRESEFKARRRHRPA